MDARLVRSLLMGESSIADGRADQDRGPRARQPKGLYEHQDHHPGRGGGNDRHLRVGRGILESIDMRHFEAMEVSRSRLAICRDMHVVRKPLGPVVVEREHQSGTQNNQNSARLGKLLTTS